MALDFIVNFCNREADGSLVVSITAQVDGLNWDKTRKLQGADAADLENQLRPLMQKAKDKYDQELQLKATAQAKVDALKIELGIE